MPDSIIDSNDNDPAQYFQAQAKRIEISNLINKGGTNSEDTKASEPGFVG